MTDPIQSAEPKQPCSFAELLYFWQLDPDLLEYSDSQALQDHLEQHPPCAACMAALARNADVIDLGQQVLEEYLLRKGSATTKALTGTKLPPASGRGTALRTASDAADGGGWVVARFEWGPQPAAASSEENVWPVIKVEVGNLRLRLTQGRSDSKGVSFRLLIVGQTLPVPHVLLELIPAVGDPLMPESPPPGGFVPGDHILFQYAGEPRDIIGVRARLVESGT